MSDDIHHATVITQGDTELAPVHQYNVGMYSDMRAYGKELA